VKPMHHRRWHILTAALAAIAAAFAITACAAEEKPTPAAPAAPDAAAPAAPDAAAPAPTPTPQTEGISVSAVVHPDRTYTMDDLVAAGYKKSKQFDVDTVPRATDVWYGFFNQRDIEVRVYASHGDALEFGVAPAEEAIGHEAGQRDYLIPVVNLYPAYMVVGNLVMLCERELAVCQALVDKLP